MAVKTMKSSEEQKQVLFEVLIKHLPLSYDNNIVLNFTQRHRYVDINGNSHYNYSFYGIESGSCRISDMTWSVANILGLKYDDSKMYIIGYDGLAKEVVSKLNKIDLNYKEIVAKEVL